MKIQHLIPILFLAAFCTVSAQTKSATSPTLLTTNQVKLLALQLANDKARNIYGEEWTNKADIFDTKSTERVGDIVRPTTFIEVRFEGGHWMSSIVRRWNYIQYRAKVEIAPDGSTNSANVSEYISPGFQPDGSGVAIASNLGNIPYIDASDRVNIIVNQNRKVIATLVDGMRLNDYSPDSKVCIIYLLGELRPNEMNAIQVLVDNIDFVAQQSDPGPKTRRWGMYPAQEALSKIGMPAVKVILDTALPEESNQHRLNLMSAVLQDVLGKEIAIIIVDQRMEKELNPLRKVNYEYVLKRLEM